MYFSYNGFVVYNTMLIVPRIWLDLQELELDLKAAHTPPSHAKDTDNSEDARDSLCNISRVQAFYEGR